MTDLSSHQDVGQRLDLANLNRTEFVNAMAHLYRGELSEATAWRTRIDTTSNWAVVMSVTTLSFVFAGQGNERHVLIPIVTMFCTFLLFMEARRYRFYDIWRSRARMIEINFYRPILDGTPPAMTGWAETLGIRSRVAAFSHVLVGSRWAAPAPQLPMDLCCSARKLAGGAYIVPHAVHVDSRSHRTRRNWANPRRRRHGEHVAILWRTICVGRL